MARKVQLSAADMSRNKDLAGKTVSKGGFNITYNDQGYATKASNYNHKLNQGTDRGVAAPSADAVLSGGSRGGYSGSSSDKQHLSDKELKSIEAARQAAQAGTMSWGEAHAEAERYRAKYGYSGGEDGSGYTPLTVRQFDLNGGSSGRGGVSGGGISGGVAGGASPFSYASAPQYVNRYQSQIDDLTAQILGRAAFEYDPEKDPAYQQYKESYTRSGQRAMQDTLGQVSARTGGLASSYAAGAAQQTYDNYMGELADKVPELRQLAYSMYQDEGAQQRANLEMLMALEQGDYAKYQSLLSQYNTDRSFDYGVHRDSVGDQRYDNEWNYQVGRDQIADQRYEDETAYDRERYESEKEYDQALAKAQTLAAAGDFSGYKDLGYSDSEISRLKTAYDAAQMLSRRSSSGGSSGSGQRGSGTAAAAGDWGAVENWVSLYGADAAKDYIKEHYKDLGYSSQSAALAGWNNHLLEAGGGGDGMEDYGNATVDMGSVLALGYGPISEDRLAELEATGEIESYIEDGKIKFRRTTRTGGSERTQAGMKNTLGLLGGK